MVPVARRRPPRFRLLEPVAQYARVRLEEAGEWDLAVAAHAEHFVALAEETGPRYRTAGRWPRSRGSTSSTPT